MAGPDTLMIIRHGEKPADPPATPPPYGVDAEGKQSEHSLVPRGWQRAGALAKVLGAATPPAPLVQPTAIFAPDYSAETTSHRTTETVTPLGDRLGLQIQKPVAKGAEEQLVLDHLVSAAGHVLVCWEHHHIPAIVAGLGTALGVSAIPAIGRSWPDDDFDSVLVFTRSADGYSLAVTSQDALAGDTP